jgi:hypothetical protein
MIYLILTKDLDSFLNDNVLTILHAIPQHIEGLTTVNVSLLNALK